MYIATSARRSSVVAESPCSGKLAMPMLTRQSTTWPSSDIGASSAFWMLRATRRAPSALSEGSSTTNSSPPRRATVSDSRRTIAASRSATSRSSRSPIGWPSVSLTYLKRSTSISSTLTDALARGAMRSACCSRSVNSARLGRPVSVSR